MHTTKKFYIGLTFFLFAVAVVSGLNNAQGYIMGYPTTQPLVPYLIREIVAEALSQFFVIACFIVPCLAGELLHFEVFPKKPQGGFFHYLSTTFLSRQVAQVILLGYAFAVIMVGLQSVIFEMGTRYLDVWVEQMRLSRMSSGYLPFLAAFIIGSNASLVEETLYRLFGISFGVKFLKRLPLAVLVSSLVWGLGHTGYAVFPFWFRGLEVTLLGIFMALVYLRFGIICVIVVHFLFDAFWASSPYIFGRSDPFNFAMSLVVLSLPFWWAAAAYLQNRPEVRKSLEWRLNASQKFNLEILKGFILRKRAEPGFNPETLRIQLIHNGWDIAIIDVGFKQLNITVAGENHWHSA
jgi:hypothetical protein